MNNMNTTNIDGMTLFQNLPSEQKRLFVKLVVNQKFSTEEWDVLINNNLAEKANSGFRFMGEGQIIRKWIGNMLERALWFRRECWSYYRANGIKWEQGK